MVIDASAAVRTLDRDPAALQLRARMQATECHAPHLYDAEIGHVVRGHERAGRLEPDEAARALAELTALIDHRYPHVGALAARAWSLRHNLSFYDGLYAGLAAALDVPLLTHDARVRRAPDLPCRVELV
ncbi:MAG TPA: type II toxin-antitoxin system VapC family toxin [Solirubrobacteraceae bacterium]|nr:type II toxin-antitoxin system VapC family toxin [Solirubrobacteraceae bacterium]